MAKWTEQSLYRCLQHISLLEFCIRTEIIFFRLADKNQKKALSGEEKSHSRTWRPLQDFVTRVNDDKNTKVNSAVCTIFSGSSKLKKKAINELYCSGFPMKETEEAINEYQGRYHTYAIHLQPLDKSGISPRPE
ncbi:hypothetical protein LOAG_06083 [Loa loa]|uniref:Uncharacterized protein n=1 Tax=Loa loa TaxID=7209 RepID=A0A1S0TZ52_LOALO|nr:hypothetical protein LOAG_06083 [Loa loa]EFO22402.1 hypothetical protein LOAG_06083 [Loa loa]